MPPLRGFYNPRNPFRTPGFAPEGLIEDEQREQPSMPMAAESRSYTPPEPEQMDAPPPQQSQRRSIDLSGELDRIKRAPAPPCIARCRRATHGTRRHRSGEGQRTPARCGSSATH